MQRDIQIMMEILRCSAEGKKIDEKIISDITPGMLYEIYAVANIHGLLQLPANIVEKFGIAVDDILLEKCRKHIMDAVYHYEKKSFETKQISEVFEKNGIQFILLKGEVIKNFYSEPWLRTSCDVDILVHKNDLVRAGFLLENELKYKRGNNGAHHIAYSSQSDVQIELHFALIEKNHVNKAQKIAEKVWDYSSVKSGCEYEKTLNESFLYFYHIAHCATHFEAGGCGIKPVLDLYLLKKRVNTQTREIRRLLRKSELIKFEYYLSKLSDVWFLGEEHDEVTHAMEDFIINGGLRGTQKQNLLFKKYHFKGKTGYFFSRLFVPLEELKIEFPILNKATFLFPFFGFFRWLKLLFKREKNKMIERYKIVENIPETDMKIYGEMFDKIGL